MVDVKLSKRLYYTRQMKSKKNIKNVHHHEIEHFSNLDHIWWGAKTYAGQKRYDDKFSRLKSYCRPDKNFRILEIGAGDGEFTKRILKIGARIFATDITPIVVKRGKKILVKKDKASFKIENAERLTFRGESFDLVCGVSVLHHLDMKKALREAFRVLKKNGQIFFTEPNLLNPNIFIGLKMPFLRKKMEYSPDETALVRWNVERLLREIGFSKVKVENYDFLHPLTPKGWVKFVSNLSKTLEKTPVVKEISGSLIVWAEK